MQREELFGGNMLFEIAPESFHTVCAEAAGAAFGVGMITGWFITLHGCGASIDVHFYVVEMALTVVRVVDTAWGLRVCPVTHVSCDDWMPAAIHDGVFLFMISIYIIPFHKGSAAGVRGPSENSTGCFRALDFVPFAGARFIRFEVRPFQTGYMKIIQCFECVLRVR